MRSTGSISTCCRGKCLGVVGESGSGKSATFLSVMGLVRPPGRIVDGPIRFDGIELTSLDERARRALRGDSGARAGVSPCRTRIALSNSTASFTINGFHLPFDQVLRTQAGLVKVHDSIEFRFAFGGWQPYCPFRREARKRASSRPCGRLRVRIRIGPGQRDRCRYRARCGRRYRHRRTAEGCPLRIQWRPASGAADAAGPDATCGSAVSSSAATTNCSQVRVSSRHCRKGQPRHAQGGDAWPVAELRGNRPARFLHRRPMRGRHAAGHERRSRAESLYPGSQFGLRYLQQVRRAAGFVHREPALGRRCVDLQRRVVRRSDRGLRRAGGSLDTYPLRVRVVRQQHRPALFPVHRGVEDRRPGCRRLVAVSGAHR